jgi:hypothetical protein
VGGRLARATASARPPARFVIVHSGSLARRLPAVDDGKIAARSPRSIPRSSTMAKTSLAMRVENHEQRLVRIEQFLPTLATKADLRAVEVKVDALATKVEALDAKVGALDAKVDDNYRNVRILLEDLRSTIQVIAEQVAHLWNRVLEK